MCLVVPFYISGNPWQCKFNSSWIDIHSWSAQLAFLDSADMLSVLPRPFPVLPLTALSDTERKFQTYRSRQIIWLNSWVASPLAEPPPILPPDGIAIEERHTIECITGVS